MADENTFTCHCSDPATELPEWRKGEIRKEVCRDLPFYAQFGGRDYCVLHYPGEVKEGDFEPVVRERISRGHYDFRHVYFPDWLRLEHHVFAGRVNFSSATFTRGADFGRCEFRGQALFARARFLDETSFSLAEFHGSVNFFKAEFEAHVSFSATFHEEAKAGFEEAAFKNAEFGDAEFHHEVTFAKATFTGRADFRQAKFFSKAVFSKTAFPDDDETDFVLAEFHAASDFAGARIGQANFGFAKFGLTTRSPFDRTVFTKASFGNWAGFEHAEFHIPADFEEASFAVVTFEDAGFARGVSFSAAHFLADAYFDGTVFGLKEAGRIVSAHANFRHAVFDERARLFFRNTWFSSVADFSYTTIEGRVLFKGGERRPVFEPAFEKEADLFQGTLNLGDAGIENPSRISFHTVRLRPNWFVNVDCREFGFTNIDWKDEAGRDVNVRGEMLSLMRRREEHPHKLLRIAFRHLAVNYEENNRFEEASAFRRMAMEVEWLEKKRQVRDWLRRLVLENSKLQNRFGGSTSKRDRPTPPTTSFGIVRRGVDLLLYWPYRFTSFYGESWGRAALVLFLILSVPVYLYTRTEFYVCPADVTVSEGGRGGRCETRKLKTDEAVRHSMATATFQNVDNRKPVTGWGETFIILEKIFAPLQAALLALAIRRKFMR